MHYTANCEYIYESMISFPNLEGAKNEYAEYGVQKILAVFLFRAILVEAYIFETTTIKNMVCRSIESISV